MGEIALFLPEILLAYAKVGTVGPSNLPAAPYELII